MKIRTTSQKFVISHTLVDGDSDKFVRAFIYNQDGNSVAPAPGYVNLVHVSNGLYMNTGSSFTMPEGFYIVLVKVFSDSGYTVPDLKYGCTEDDVWVTNFEQTILNKIPNNILLDNDARLNNLNTIPSLATTSQLNTKSSEIINQVNANADNSDGRAI